MDRVRKSEDATQIIRETLEKSLNEDSLDGFNHGLKVLVKDEANSHLLEPTPLELVPILLLANDAITVDPQPLQETYELIARYGSPKEVLLVVQESLDTLSQEAKELENDEESARSTPPQIIWKWLRLIDMYTLAFPRLVPRKRSAPDTAAPIIQHLRNSFRVLGQLVDPNEPVSQELVEACMRLGYALLRWFDATGSKDDRITGCKTALEQLLSTAIAECLSDKHIMQNHNDFLYRLRTVGLAFTPAHSTEPAPKMTIHTRSQSIGEFILYYLSNRGPVRPKGTRQALKKQLAGLSVALHRPRWRQTALGAINDCVLGLYDDEFLEEDIAAEIIPMMSTPAATDPDSKSRARLFNLLTQIILKVQPVHAFKFVRDLAKTWQNELKILFEQAKSRYADVVWDMLDDNDQRTGEIWGHKAIVYARAPPSFQARYFAPRTASESPGPYSAQNLLPAQSSISLSLPPADSHPRSRSPPPFEAPQRSHSPVSSGGGVTLLRIPLAINPSLFSNELEYLYTGRGMGLAFEFLFDPSAEDGNTKSSQSTVELERRDKLRKDLVYLWRSRLYSDVRITITGSLSSSNSEVTTAVFASHRFILISRVPYFRTLLSSTFAPVGQNVSSSDPLPLNLPAPPFTPASLHFTLGFIYTGTMAFSHRPWDLDTIFNIVRSAKYLGLDTLDNEARARIITEMMHGLFHAYLPFDEYERVTEAKWGTGGCKCRQCQRRAPRVLEFALGDDILDNILERGAQRALTHMYGEGWATSEFLALSLRLKNALLKDVNNRTVTHNIIPLLQATQAGLYKLSSNSEPQAEVVRDLMRQERKKIDEVLCSNLRDFCEQPEWVDLLIRDGAELGDMDKFDLVLESIRRGLADHNAGHIYQTLVSSILLREGPTPDITTLSNRSALRVKVERLRVDTIQWMRKHWTSVRMSSCFDSLEGWALKEINDELDVLIEDIASSSGPCGSTTRTGRTSLAPPRPDANAGSTSIHSVATGATNQNVNSGGAQLRREPVASHSQSIRSVASRHSSTLSPRPPAGAIHPDPNPTRLRPVTVSPMRRAPRVSATNNSETAGTVSSNPPGPNQPRNSTTSATGRSRPSTTSPNIPAGRPRSLAPSINSIHSRASTISDSGRNKNPPVDEPHSNTDCSKEITPDTAVDVGNVPLSREQPPIVQTPTSDETLQPKVGFQGDSIRISTINKTPGADSDEELTAIEIPISRQMIHGDLKGANVLISDDGTPVLTDFGNSFHPEQTMKFTETTSSSSLTVRWSAAELINETGVRSRASDVYALAMTIYEVLAGILPYHGKNEIAIMHLVLLKHEPPERPKGIPTGQEGGDKIWNLLLRCWSFKPEARPSASQVADILKTVNPEGLSLAQISL
ncbi:hypothetical protein FRC11_000530 [Ceratobasidium sp. 423]|nr:hypothetical protein FRC11_000530 [Ceratobasidium sp. 423]